MAPVRRATVVGVYVVLVVFGLIPTVGYFVVERVTNGEPPAEDRAEDWVTAVWSVDGGIGIGTPVLCDPVCDEEDGPAERAWLIAEHPPEDADRDFVPRFGTPPPNPGPDPDHVAYTVSVCGYGGGTVRGLFLLGRGARLTDVQAPEVPWTAPPLPGRAVIGASVDPRSRIEDTAASLEALRRPFPLDGVQAVPFEFPKQACNDADLTSGERPPSDYRSATLYGKRTMPLVQEYTVGPMVGAHQRRDWPTLGVRGLELGPIDIPGVDTVPLSAQGSTTTYRLETGGLGQSRVADSVTPTPVEDDLVFEVTGEPLAASARTTDLDAQEHWRGVLTGLGILVGVTGGIVATLVMTGLLSIVERQRRAPEDEDPTGTDPARVAADLRRLADRLDTAVPAGGASSGPRDADGGAVPTRG